MVPAIIAEASGMIVVFVTATGTLRVLQGVTMTMVRVPFIIAMVIVSGWAAIHGRAFIPASLPELDVYVPHPRTSAEPQPELEVRGGLLVRAGADEFPHATQPISTIADRKAIWPLGEILMDSPRL
jgi:hypothetical protein